MAKPAALHAKNPSLVLGALIVVRRLCHLYGEFFRGTPVLVQLLVI